MKTALVAATMLLVSWGTAQAYPTYQLWMDPASGASYDTTTHTWVSASTSFTLSAFYDPASKDGPGSISGVRLAVALPLGVTPSDGTLSVAQQGGGTLSDSGWRFDAPPISAVPLANGAKNMPPHGIYPTWFTEYLFDFSHQALIFDSQPGGETGTKPGYREDFDISLGGFGGAHFDLYSVVVDSGPKKDGGIDQFAPLSHDAEFNPPIPEPRTMVLLGISLITAAGYMKRIYRKRP